MRCMQTPEPSSGKPLAETDPNNPNNNPYLGLVRLAMFAALIAVMGFIPKLDLPFLAGVPITVQTLGVMMAGLFLGARQGALAVLLFIFVVCLGAPFLSGGRGGLGVLFGPTAGFLMGWVIGAFLVGLIFTSLRRMRVNLYWAALVACLIGGIAGIYLPGIPWLSWRASMPLDKAALVSLAFVPGDVIKAFVAAWLARQLERELPKL